MDCHESRLLIDERVHGSLSPDLSANLDAHLKSCGDCRDDLRQLEKTRAMLQSARDIHAPENTMRNTWLAVQKATAAAKPGASAATARSIPKPRAPITLTRWKKVAIASLMAAAIFIVAMQLGALSYSSPSKSARLAANESVAKAAKAYAEAEETARGPLYATVKAPQAAQQIEVLRRVESVEEQSETGITLGPRATAERPYRAGDAEFASAKSPPPPPLPPPLNAPDPNGDPTMINGLHYTNNAIFGIQRDRTLPPQSPDNVPRYYVLDKGKEVSQFVYGSTAGGDAQSSYWNSADTWKGGESSGYKNVDVVNGQTKDGLYAKNFKLSDMELFNRDEWGHAQSSGNPMDDFVAEYTRRLKPKGTLDPKGDESNPKATPPSKLKIIKTGELTLEIKNFAESTRAAEALAAKFQAQIADSRTGDLSGGAKRGDIVIRVAPEHFEELFAELRKLGTVLTDRAGAADITAQYVDTEARIKNMSVEEERLQELVKSKTYLDKIQSLLEVERELSRVRGEIEAMQGQMRVWQEQIALSTIRLTLQEPARAVPSGGLSVEVANLTDSKKALDAALTNAGAQLLNGQTSKRSDGTLMGNYALRVKFGRFAELAAAIKGLGRVQDEKILNQPFAAGVPDGAQDVPCEIALVLFERSIQLPTGNLQIEVAALPDATSKLELALAAAQATIVSNQTQRQGNGVSTAQLSLRVRAGNFAALVDALPALGRVAHRTVGGESGKVQGGAADVPCSIELQLFEQPKEIPGGAMTLEVSTFTDARDRLNALTKENGLYVSAADSRQRSDGTWTGSFTLNIKAEKMDAVIGQLEKLGRVKSREVKGVGLGELSRIDPNVVGEIAVTLQETPNLAPQEEGAFRLMLRDTFGGFLTSMGYVIRGLGMMLPWLLVIALIFGAIWRWTKKTIKN